MQLSQSTGYHKLDYSVPQGFPGVPKGDKVGDLSLRLNQNHGFNSRLNTVLLEEKTDFEKRVEAEIARLDGLISQYKSSFVDGFVPVNCLSEKQVLVFKEIRTELSALVESQLFSKFQNHIVS